MEEIPNVVGQVQTLSREDIVQCNSNFVPAYYDVPGSWGEVPTYDKIL